MHCFLICMNLKDSHRLRTIIERSIKASCPAHVANSILDNMRTGGWDCPDQSTISRFRLSMDTGYMEIMRQEHARYTFDASSVTVLDGPAIYSSLDSSLQGNIEWEVMYYTLIEESDLIPLSKCVNRLIHLRTEPATEARNEEIRSINLFITNAVKIHIMPPGGLGSKRLGLIHKLLKYCHSARLEHHTLASLQVCTGRTFPSPITQQKHGSGPMRGYPPGGTFFWCRGRGDQGAGTERRTLTRLSDPRGVGGFQTSAFGLFEAVTI